MKAAKTTRLAGGLSTGEPCKIELTPYQRIFYNEWLRNPGGSNYNMIFDQEDTGCFDADRYNKALVRFANEHLLMNSNVKENDSEPFWIKRPNVKETETVVEYYPEPLSDAEVFQLVARPYDLEKDRLFRAFVIRLAASRYRIIHTFHHILVDGLSCRTLYDSGGIYYNQPDYVHPASIARQAQMLLELNEQFRQNAIASSSQWQQFWAEELKDLQSADLRFLSNYSSSSASATEPVREAGECRFSFDNDIYAQLKSASRQYKLTPYIYGKIVFAILLHRITGQKHIGISYPTAIMEGKELICGAHINTVIAGFRFDRETTLSALIECTLSYYKRLKQIKANYMPVYDLISYAEDKEMLEVAYIQTDLKDNPTKYDGIDEIKILNEFNIDFAHKLLFEQEIRDAEIHFRVRYDKQGLDSGLVKNFTHYYQKLFREILADLLNSNSDKKISGYRILSDEEEEKIVINGSGNGQPFAEQKTIHGLFEEQVNRTPDNTALVYENVRLSYRELNEKANRLAHYLRQKYTIGYDDKVALCLGRSEHLLIAMLAVLKTGAAYVPVDPVNPQERIAYITGDAGAKLVLTDMPNAELLEGIDCTKEIIDTAQIQARLKDFSSENSPAIGSSENLFYIIYTSGTTGNPKGVMIAHRHINAVIHGIRDAYDFTSTAKITAFTSFGFDVSSSEIFVALLYGNELHLLSENLRADTNALSNYLVDNKIEYVYLPPVVLASLPRLAYPHLKTIVYAGEPCDYETGKYWSSRKRLYNYYGPTETNIATGKLIENGDVHLIGKPIPNASVYVLDDTMALLPIGAIGELYIGGDAVARGYLNLPELTNERFLLNPFQTGEEAEQGRNARLYKTGDLVRSLPGGDLEFIGRNDFQVKIHGFRVEPGEIEAVLNNYPGIRQCIVIVKGRGDVKYLAAYYVAEGPVAQEVLLLFLKENLPDYMVPAALMQLDELPLTINGKIDRKALPEPHYFITNEYAAPENAIQEKLCELYAEVLGLDGKKISIDDDFFRLSGSSILAVKLVGKIGKAFNITLSIVSIFTCRTIRKLSEQLHSSQPMTVVKTGEGEEHILSFAQERLWFLETFDPSFTYNMPAAYKLKLSTNVESLESAIHAVIRRHHVLSSLIKTSDDGSGYQEVQDYDRFPLKFEREVFTSNAELNESIYNSFMRVFALDREYPVRVKIYVSDGSDSHTYLTISFHHIAFDGWSSDIFYRELQAYYYYYEAIRTGDEQLAQSYLPGPVQLQYKDFAAWQREYLTGEVLESQLSYWRNKLAGHEILNLATDRKRPPTVGHEGAEIHFEIDADISRRLKKVAKELEVSTYSLLLSAYYLMLQSYSGQEDIIVGTPAANRHISDIQETIGFFINIMALRQRIDCEKKLVDFIREVGANVIDAQMYQDVPFEKIVQEIEVRQDPSRHPVFQVVFTVQHFDLDDLKEEGLFENWQPEYRFTPAKFDITTHIDDSRVTIQGVFNYSVSIFDAATIESYITTYKEILRQFATLDTVSGKSRKIRDTSFLNDSDYEKIIHEWNDTRKSYPDKAIHELFEEQAQLQAENLAVKYKNTVLTRGELNEDANRLAAYLKERFSLKPDDVIALCLDRSELLPIGIMAVLKSGAAYVPIDPALPAERISYMLRDARPKVVLTNLKYGKSLFENNEADFHLEFIDDTDFKLKLSAFSSANPVNNVKPGDLAYVLYTSGTTGNPKGVQVQHGGVVSYIKCMQRDMEISAPDRMLAVTTISFDISVLEIIVPLGSGGGVVIADDYTIKDAASLLEVMRTESITLMATTPSRWRMLLEAGWKEKLPIKVICGGESLPEELRDELLPLCESFTNQYGPTEITVAATQKKMTAGDEISIGAPFDNFQIYLLNKYLQPVPCGGIGEIYIGGDGLAKGYLNMPELTRERFIPNPFQTREERSSGKNGRLYKTGDLARFFSSGDIEYLGRNDTQVKVNGYRIETGEIEAVMSSFPDVKQAVVLAKSQGHIQFLAGYYASEEPVDHESLFSFMAEYVPEYMMPKVLVHLAAIPMTTNGKIDRKALPDPEFTGSTEYYEPENNIQEKLCAIFGEILGLDPARVSIRDDFFRIGGTSIASVKLLNAIKNTFHSNISLADIFTAKTVKGLSELIGRRTGAFELITPLNACAANENMIMIHPGGAGCEVYVSLAAKLSEYYSCYGIDSYNLYHVDMINDFSKLAGHYLAHIEKVQEKTGRQSYTLLGWSLGGMIALEVAAQLEEKGIEDITVILLDTLVNDGEMICMVKPETREEIEEFKLKMGNAGVHESDYELFYQTEKELQLQPVSRKLRNTQVVLFKAMKFDDSVKSRAGVLEHYIKCLDFNNVDKVMESVSNISVIKMTDVTHWSILLGEDIIQSEIINRYAENIRAEAELQIG